MTANTHFATRRKLLTVRKDAMQCASDLRDLLAPEKAEALRTLLTHLHPADVVDAMQFLDEKEDKAVFNALEPSEAAVVLDEVDNTTRGYLVKATSRERLAAIVNALPSDEGADLIGVLSPDEAKQTLALAEPGHAANVETLLAYKPETAGGIMSLGYVSVRPDVTAAEALNTFRDCPNLEPVLEVYVTDEAGVLIGILDLHRLLKAPPTRPVRDLMHPPDITVPPDMDQEQVAHIFARYDLTVLPVVEAQHGKLLGIITADDILDVMQQENAEDVAHFSGSDAHELEKKSPFEVARLRLPWIMATMFIELLAGVVIHVFDGTLERIILLASFMPIISAISGNTGLQSAAIIIRGLSSGQVQLAHWKHALARQVTTTAILGGTCAATLGLIGGIWSHKFTFGLVVFLGMFASVNIAGIVGTIVPLLSKRAGFDPALTAGPFETAFQDVIGISIFLGLATLLLRFLH